LTAAVQVLLATWNGARYLPELLDSLAAQTSDEFTLLARDDGSSDDTVALLEAWGEAHPGRCEIIRDGIATGSPTGNFQRLLAASTANYVSFCDQDDVWKPHKIADTLACIRAVEARRGSNTPIVVHSDLQVVDGSLAELDASFWHFQKLDPELGRRLERILVQNVVTGCAAMANRALLERALPVPPDAIMHDWWLGCVAAAFGEVEPLSSATIAYRQHGGNDTGAKHFSTGYVWRKFWQAMDTEELQDSLSKTQRQARAFYARFGHQLSRRQRRAVRTWAELDSLAPLARRLRMLREGLLKIGLIRNLGLLARV
jgi:hypothetical protein